MMKKSMTILLALALTLSAAACGSESASSQGSSSQSSSGSSSQEVSGETTESSSEAAESSTPTPEEPVLPSVPHIEADPALSQQVKEAYEGTGEFSQQQTVVMKTDMGDITIRLFPQYAPKAVENFITHAKNGYYDGLIFHRVIEDFMVQGGDPLGVGTGGESIWGAPFEDEFTDVLHNFRGALSMANSGANTNGSQFFIVQNDTPMVEEQWYATVLNGGYMGTKVQEAQMELYAASTEGKSEEELQKLMEELNAKLDTEATSQEAQDYMKRMAAGRDLYMELGGAPHLDQMHTVFGYVSQGMDVVDKIAAVEKDENDKPKTDIKIISIRVS